VISVCLPDVVLKEIMVLYKNEWVNLQKLITLTLIMTQKEAKSYFEVMD